MASKKTSMFTLTERLTITADNVETSATIDLGSYVDVGDRQALQIHSVDFIFQGTTANASMLSTFTTNATALVQITDLNRGGLVFADDRALVASAAMSFADENIITNDADMYPDNFGKGSEDGRYVVNDQLYITGITANLDTNKALNVTVRVNATIVTLSAKDFMAIAIQSTAADN
tara:strand:- start:2063 stop:2590 length:528 start_codon:yes stop_codon:yes gene_type:complete